VTSPSRLPTCHGANRPQAASVSRHCRPERGQVLTHPSVVTVPERLQTHSTQSMHNGSLLVGIMPIFQARERESIR